MSSLIAYVTYSPLTVTPVAVIVNFVSGFGLSVSGLSVSGLSGLSVASFSTVISISVAFVTPVIVVVTTPSSATFKSPTVASPAVTFVTLYPNSGTIVKVASSFSDTNLVFKEAVALSHLPIVNSNLSIIFSSGISIF